MADEISVTARLTVANGSLAFDRNVVRKQFDQTTARVSGGVQTIGTGSHEALGVGADISSAGYAFFQNLDATNYVEIGIDDTGTFEPLLKLEAGEVAVCPLTTTGVYAQANTAAVELEFYIIER